MKKQWISVKCGLSRDPKHRRQMGKSVWTFLHMLDLADWETGIVYDWKDENAAEDMGIDTRVLREDRRKLDDEGYITCQQKQYSQDIYIHNWTNPREYSGEVRNAKPQGGKKSPPSDFQGDSQGYAQGSVKDVTPTSYSKNKEQTDHFLETQELLSKASPEWALLAGVVVDDKALILAQIEQEAINAFESAFALQRPWDWHPDSPSDKKKTWDDFRAYIVKLYQQDKDGFGKYVTWSRQPYVKGAMTALGIKRNPQDFPDSWAGYLAQSVMYKREEEFTRLL